MLTINLISLEQKKEIKLKRLYESLKKNYFVFIILTCLTGFVFLAADLILKNVFSKTALQNSLITKTGNSFNSKITVANNQINSAAAIQKNYKPWSPLIKDLADKTPANIKLDLISINGENHTVQLKGEAKYRDDLLAFKKALEQSGAYNDIELPLQNMLQQKNVSFDITVNFNDKL